MILYIYCWMSTFKDRFKQIKTNKSRVLSCAPLTFHPQRDHHALVLDAVHQLAAVHPIVLQLQVAQLQRRVHHVSPAQWGPPAQGAVGFAALLVGHQDDVLWADPLRLQFGPLDSVLAGFGPQEAWQRDVLAPAACDLGVHWRLEQVLQIQGCCSWDREFFFLNDLFTKSVRFIWLYFIYLSCSEKMLTGGHETSSLPAASPFIFWLKCFGLEFSKTDLEEFTLKFSEIFDVLQQFFGFLFANK